MSFIMFIQLIVISIHFLFNSQNFIAHPFCFLGEISHEPQCDFFTVWQRRNCFMTVPWNIRLDLGRIMSWVHSQVVLNWVWCAGKNADANSRRNGFKLSRIPPNCSHLNQHGKKKKSKAQFFYPLIVHWKRTKNTDAAFTHVASDKAAKPSSLCS